jgi:hypothetical protein
MELGAGRDVRFLESRTVMRVRGTYAGFDRFGRIVDQKWVKDSTILCSGPAKLS